MTEGHTQRRLAAILAADVVNYSRLMHADEVGTLAALKTRRREILNPLIARHGGRLFKLVGDGAMVEFASAVGAVQCAVALQEAFTSANTALPEERRIVLRIGVHVGDVLVEGTDLYGDGVNIAARLEGVALPGGVLISEDVHRQVTNKLDLTYDDMGPQHLKNIPQPVRAFRVATVGVPVRASSAPTQTWEKASIAILPFTNMGGDKEQDYFSDGITEDIITEISRFRELRVIARNSSFAFRGQNLAVAEIARKLGVQFVVEGSVRKAGNRLRITAQLIEASTDRHVWAERYDRNIEDIFSTQDEIARTVAAIAAGHVTTAAAARSRTRPTESLSAYDLILQARAMLNRYGRHAEDRAEAETLVARAIGIDSQYSAAHAMMARILALQSEYDVDAGRLERAADFARRAIKLDPDEPMGHAVLGYCLTYLKRVPEAGAHLEKAAQLNSNDVLIAIYRALWLCYAGRVAEALGNMQDVLKCDPFGPEWFWGAYSIVLVVAGRFNEAIATFEKMVLPHQWELVYAAIAQVNMQNMSAARELVARATRSNPGLSLEDNVRYDPFVDPALTERLVSDLRKAL
jgi:adenylate cyclase